MITHDIETDFAIADRIVVLRLGQVVYDGAIKGVSQADLVHLVSGIIPAPALVSPSSILLASTDPTYHPFVVKRTTFYEDHIQQPIDIDAVTKVMSEDLFLTYYREYELPVKRMRYSSVIAADEALQILTPGWLDMFINVEWTMPKRVPWFGAENVEASKMAVAMQTPNAVCGITDANGVSCGLPFTDVRDTVAGTLLVLDSPDAIGDIFNMVGPSATALVPADGVTGLRPLLTSTLGPVTAVPVRPVDRRKHSECSKN